MMHLVDFKFVGEEFTKEDLVMLSTKDDLRRLGLKSVHVLKTVSLYDLDVNSLCKTFFRRGGVELKVWRAILQHRAQISRMAPNTQTRTTVGIPLPNPRSPVHNPVFK